MLRNLTIFAVSVIAGCMGALFTAMIIGLYVGPFLMPNEFVTDTGPNIHSPYLWVPSAMAFVGAAIFTFRVFGAET